MHMPFLWFPSYLPHAGYLTVTLVIPSYTLRLFLLLYVTFGCAPPIPAVGVPHTPSAYALLRLLPTFPDSFCPSLLICPMCHLYIWFGCLPPSYYYMSVPGPLPHMPCLFYALDHSIYIHTYLPSVELVGIATTFVPVPATPAGFCLPSPYASCFPLPPVGLEATPSDLACHPLLHLLLLLPTWDGFHHHLAFVAFWVFSPACNLYTSLDGSGFYTLPSAPLFCSLPVPHARLLCLPPHTTWPWFSPTLPPFVGCPLLPAHPTFLETQPADASHILPTSLPTWVPSFLPPFPSHHACLPTHLLVQSHPLCHYTTILLLLCHGGRMICCSLHSMLLIVCPWWWFIFPISFTFTMPTTSHDSTTLPSPYLFPAGTFTCLCLSLTCLPTVCVYTTLPYPTPLALPFIPIYLPPCPSLLPSCYLPTP